MSIVNKSGRHLQFIRWWYQRTTIEERRITENIENFYSDAHYEYILTYRTKQRYALKLVPVVHNLVFVHVPSHMHWPYQTFCEPFFCRFVILWIVKTQRPLTVPVLKFCSFLNLPFPVIMKSNCYLRPLSLLAEKRSVCYQSGIFEGVNKHSSVGRSGVYLFV